MSDSRIIKGLQEDITPPGDIPNFYENDMSNLSTYRDLNDIMRERVFLGDVPYDSIIDGLKYQFDNYLNLEDRSDYVDIYYTQRGMSLSGIRNDDFEEDADILSDIMDNIHLNFIDIIKELFSLKFQIGIPEIEKNPYSDDAEFTIRKLYDYFILGARSVLTTVISSNIVSRMDHSLLTLNDDNLSKITDEINIKMEDYYGLITILDCESFLKISGNSTIVDMYNQGYFNGNFLRKFSPKLYENVDLITDIIAASVDIIDLIHWRFNIIKEALVSNIDPGTLDLWKSEIKEEVLV